MRLVEQCDVFVENFKASGLDRMGISVSELQARNPGLIIVRMPPAGTTGDWSSYAGFGAQFDGLTGFLSLCGHRGSDLTTSPATTYMDAASGPAGAFAAMAALRYRAATGRGQLIELAQSENVINHLGDVLRRLSAGRHATPARQPGPANERRRACTACGDGNWLAISVGDDQEWTALAALIGGPEQPTTLVIAMRPGARAHHDELDALLSSWVEARDALDAFHELQRHGVPAAPLLNDRMFCEDPHVRARGWLQPLTTTDVGTHLHAGHPYRGVPLVWRRGSPGLGEDNEYVFTQHPRGQQRGARPLPPGADRGRGLPESGGYAALGDVPAHPPVDEVSTAAVQNRTRWATSALVGAANLHRKSRMRPMVAWVMTAASRPGSALPSSARGATMRCASGRWLVTASGRASSPTRPPFHNTARVEWATSGLDAWDMIPSIQRRSWAAGCRSFSI